MKVVEVLKASGVRRSSRRGTRTIRHHRPAAGEPANKRMDLSSAVVLKEVVGSLIGRIKDR